MELVYAIGMRLTSYSIWKYFFNICCFVSFMSCHLKRSETVRWSCYDF
jgi:hypothetical protein